MTVPESTHSPTDEGVCIPQDVRAFLLDVAVPDHASLGATVTLEASRRRLFVEAAQAAGGSHDPTEADVRRRIACAGFLILQGRIDSAVTVALRLVADLRAERNALPRGSTSWVSAFSTETTIRSLVKASIGKPTSWLLVDRFSTEEAPLLPTEMHDVTLEDADAVLSAVPGKARVVLRDLVDPDGRVLCDPDELRRCVVALAEDVDLRGRVASSNEGMATPPGVLEITQRTKKIGRHTYRVVRLLGLEFGDKVTDAQARALLDDAAGIKADKDALNRGRDVLRALGATTVREVS